MSNNTEAVENILTESLQWTKGDKAGNVEKVASHDGEWTIFESGARIATNLISEFMIPLEGEPLDFNPTQNLVQGPTGTNGPGPHPTGDSGISLNPAIKDNPIKTLFDKQKKTNTTSLNISFSVNIPSPEIFNIINMTFDKEEVITELQSFIKNQVSHDDLLSELDKSIKSLISTEYKTNKK
jgi:hypothetical protein